MKTITIAAGNSMMNLSFCIKASDCLKVSGLVALASMLLLVGCGGSNDAIQPMPQQNVVDARTTLAFGKCATVLNDSSVVCGTLSVPEERSDSKSRMIGLPFAVLPAKSQTKKGDPTAILTGGPGPSALLVVAGLSSEQLAAFPLRQNRDMIVLNQRGTSLTQPSDLACAEVVLDFESGARFANVDTALNALTKCRDRLKAEGANLAAYNTPSSARDLEELRQLLGKARGFTTWNVVGSSYGTLLALESMRSYPAGIRSAVLDGPLPTQVDFISEANVLDGLTEVLGACASQASCAQAFPNLQSRFSGAIEALEDAPVSIGTERVSGHFVLSAIRAVLGTGQYETIPLFMDRIAARDYTSAETLIPLSKLIELAPNTSGMWYSVSCSDNGGKRAMLDTNPANGRGWPDRVRRVAAFYESYPSSFACPMWTSGQTVVRGFDAPVKSDLPTLITVGQFDPITPVASGRLLLPNLTKSRLVVLPGKGHGLLENDACMLSIAASFVDDPLNPPNTSCAAALTVDAFVTSIPGNAAAHPKTF